MRVYQVHMVENDKSNGYSYFANKKEAKLARRRGGGARDEISEIDVEISKPGIIAALNTYAGHPDNG